MSKKILIIAMVVVATVVLGYLSFQYFSGKTPPYRPGEILRQSGVEAGLNGE